MRFEFLHIAMLIVSSDRLGGLEVASPNCSKCVNAACPRRAAPAYVDHRASTA
jgi:hypothetical protein